jgi:hypothetical protein
MKTITERYKAFENKNLGAIPTLKRAIRGMHYGKQLITNAFNKYVPKEEYSKSEKDEILEDLYYATENEKVAI